MKFKLMRSLAGVNITPSRATDGSAGYDLYVGENIEIKRIDPQFTVYKVPLGVSVEIPKGYVGLLFLRSSFGLKGWSMPNGVGVIDSDYRGEIHALLRRPGAEVIFGSLYAIPAIDVATLAAGTRIAQLVVVPHMMTPVELADSLSETTRGAGGFGSTGEQ